MRRDLVPSSAFVSAAKRFTKRQPAAAEAIRQALHRLEGDAFEPGLRTHKLQGNLAGCWAASAGYDLRVVVQVVRQGDEEAILLLSVGTHDEVY